MANKPLTDSRIKKLIDSTEKALLTGLGTVQMSISDGGGLTLRREVSGQWYWVRRYSKPNGKRNNISLGKYPDVTLKAARDKSQEISNLISQGTDPVVERKHAKLRQAASLQNSFESVARSWWENWKSSKSKNHANKVWRLLELNVLPKLGSIPISTIKPLVAQSIIEDIVQRNALDIAKRVGQYMNLIFNRAVRFEMMASNPMSALALNEVVPARKVQNQMRVSIEELPELLRDIENYDSNLTTKYALQLIALTFVRTNELRCAQWKEFDFKKNFWTGNKSTFSG